MSSNAPQAAEELHVPETAGVQAGPQAERVPWVTWLACAACLVIFVALSVQDDAASWESLARFGYLPANSIWEGDYWALVTSAFVHLALWHLVFNVYWLWVLGSHMERAIG